MRSRLKAWVGSRALGRAALGAAGGYTRHATSQLAAAIAYRVLFSLVPLAAFVVSIADALLPDKQRDGVAGWLASVVPGKALDQSVRQALEGSRVAPTIAGLVALVFLLWAASGMMAAIRVAFRVIWENDLRRKYVQSKLLDFALVLGVGLVAVVALGATLLVQVLAEIGRDLSTAIGAGTQGRAVAACRRGAHVGGVDLRDPRRPLPRRSPGRSAAPGRSGFRRSSRRSASMSQRRFTPSTSPAMATSPRSMGRSAPFSGFCWSSTSGSS